VIEGRAGDKFKGKDCHGGPLKIYNSRERRQCKKSWLILRNIKFLPSPGLCICCSFFFEHSSSRLPYSCILSSFMSRFQGHHFLSANILSGVMQNIISGVSGVYSVCAHIHLILRREQADDKQC
jgi:hypothetical protein